LRDLQIYWHPSTFSARTRKCQMRPIDRYHHSETVEQN